MAVNKVVFGGETVIDLTNDTVTPETLAEGITAHDKSGAVITGTMSTGGSGGESGLPAGYIRADYIQFAGKQIVDTGIICNQYTKIQTYFTRESSNQEYLYGVASSNNTASVTAYLGGSWRFGNKYATKPTGTISKTMGYGAYIDASSIGVTGSVTSISGITDFETKGSLLIGSCRSADGEVADDGQFDGKMCFFIMWSGDIPVLKLVPVTDGTIYRFYDMVSQTFFDSITDTPLEGGDFGAPVSASYNLRGSVEEKAMAYDIMTGGM